MKMPARLLFRRAAGMEDRGAFFRRNAGKLQFLERHRRHGGNLRPMLNGLRRSFSHFADFSVSGVVLELQPEKFQGEGVKILVGADVRRPKLSSICIETPYVVSDKEALAQARGETGKFFVHAVFTV